MRLDLMRLRDLSLLPVIGLLLLVGFILSPNFSRRQHARRPAQSPS